MDTLAKPGGTVSADGGLTITVAVSGADLDRFAERLATLIRHDRRAEQSEPWLTVEQAAEHIASPVSRIYDLRAQRLVRFVHDGRRLLTRRSWLDEYLMRHAEA